MHLFEHRDTWCKEGATRRHADRAVYSTIIHTANKCQDSQPPSPKAGPTGRNSSLYQTLLLLCSTSPVCTITTSRTGISPHFFTCRSLLGAFFDSISSQRLAMASRSLIAVLLLGTLLVCASAGVADILGSKDPDSAAAAKDTAQSWTDGAKEKLNQFTGETQAKTEEAVGDKSYLEMAKEKLDAFSKSASDSAKGVKDSVVDAAKSGKDTTTGAVSDAATKTSEAAQSAADSTVETANSVTGKAKDVAGGAAEKAQGVTGKHEEL